MFVAEAADIEIDDFVWYVYKRETSYKSQPQQYNPKHTLVLNKGDVYGVLITRKKVFQLIKADAQHVLYRNIAPSVKAKLEKESIPFRGVVEKQGVDAGFQRARRVSTTQNESKKHIRTSPFFVPEGRVDESEEYDYEDYQWRKITHNVKLESKKQGVVKTILKPGELVGLRFENPSKGGYIIYDSDKRVHISTEQYVIVAEDSKVLPLSQQLTGKVDVPKHRVAKEKVATKTLQSSRRKAINEEPRPPVVEEVIVPKYDFTNVSALDFFKHRRTTKNAVDRTNRVMKKVFDAPELPEWEGDDVEELFEDQEEGFDEETPENQEVPETDVDSEDQDEEFDEDDDSEEDGEEGEEGEEESDEGSPLADVLVEGSMFVANERKFAIVHADVMERNEHLVEYVAHDEEDDEEELYRFRLPTTYTVKQFTDKGYEILDNQLEKDELDKLQLLLEDAKFKPLPIAK